MSIKSSIHGDDNFENPIVFNLYKKCGYKIDFQVDYYRYSLKNGGIVDGL